MVSKALKMGLKPIVVINKVDRADARPQEVVNDVFDLFAALDASDEQLDFPILYGSAKEGWMAAAPEGPKTLGMQLLFDLILKHVAPPKIEDGPFRLLGTILEANPYLGRIVTGRISSSDPNLQNIPIRTEIGRQVRRAFVAEPGWRLIADDYSQVELRVMAHISGDEGLLGAFNRGEDIHASTAAAIMGVPLAEVTPDMRRVAKAVNFGLSYGQTAYGLSNVTDLTQAEAEDFIKAYFERFPKVREYIDNTKALATREGYVETLLGRRRYFPELQPGSKATHNVRQAAERMAINAPIQGTAADIINIATIHLHRALRERGLHARMILQVHDELVVEAPDEEVATVAPLMRQVMENAFDLKAPLKADLKVGQNWEEI